MIPTKSKVCVTQCLSRASPVAQGYRVHLQCRSYRRLGFYSRARKILWRRAWQPTPVFLPGESHGQRSLVGYSPWGHKESDMTEATWHHTHKCFPNPVKVFCTVYRPSTLTHDAASFPTPFLTRNPGHSPCFNPLLHMSHFRASQHSVPVFRPLWQKNRMTGALLFLLKKIFF